MTVRKRTLEQYLTTAVVLGLIVTAAGIGSLAWGAGKGGSAGVVLTSVGSALITIGILSVINDAFFKDALARDIMAAQRIQESITRAGLQAIESTDRLLLETLLEKAQRIVVRPRDPSDWADRQYASLLRAVRDHRVELDVHLPVPDTPYLDVMSERQRIPEHELKRRLDDLVNEIATAWDESVDRSKGSRLRIFQYTGVPSTGLLMTDELVLLDVGPSLRYAPADHASWTMVFKRDGSRLCEWAAMQLRVDAGGRDQPVQVNERPLPPSS